MTKKQELLADNLLEIMKKGYLRIVETNYTCDKYEINEYQNAKELIDFPIGGEEWSNAARCAGYSNGTINDIYNMGQTFNRLYDAIEAYIMNEWKKFINNVD